MQRNGVVLCVLVSMLAAVSHAQSTDQPRRKRVEFANAKQTAGGATGVLEAPPKDPLRLIPKLVMRLPEAKKATDGGYVVAIGYFAWQDGADIIINVQTFSSATVPAKDAPIAEIMRLPRKGLLTTKLGAAGYRLKELEPFGLAEFAAMLVD